MRTMSDPYKKMDESISRQIEEGLSDPKNRMVSGVNVKTGHWYEGTHEGFLKFLQEDSSNKPICENCNVTMEFHLNKGLADANEYRCPHCNNKKIVGWPRPKGE